MGKPFPPTHKRLLSGHDHPSTQNSGILNLLVQTTNFGSSPAAQSETDPPAGTDGQPHRAGHWNWLISGRLEGIADRDVDWDDHHECCQPACQPRPSYLMVH